MSSSNRFSMLSDEPYNVAPVVEKSSAKAPDSFEQQKPSNAPNARGSDDRNRHGNKGKPQGRRNNNLGAHGQNAEFQNAAPQADYKRENRPPRGDRPPRERLPGQTRQRFQDRHGSERGPDNRPKRQGRGKFNVGAPTDGAAEQTEPVQVDQAAAPAAAAEEEVKEEAVVEEPQPAVEDDGKLTLDQYLAKQAELACADDLSLNVRIAGQDIEEENFETTKVLTREDDEDDTILGGGRGGHKVSNKHTGMFNSVSAPKALHKELLNPNANSILFRGSRPSSSYQSRGPRNNKAPVNIADANAFPALGKR